MKPSTTTSRTKQDIIAQLFQQKIPENEWNTAAIRYILSYMSSMDSNNFTRKANIGEREGRCFSDMVAKRNFYFLHGIGRSGDLTEPQPKAIGSSILYKLTNELLNGLMTVYGIDLKCLLIPIPLGVSLMLCLSTINLQKRLAEYVIWFREDNEFIFKSIINGGFTPIILTTKVEISDVKLLEEKIKEIDMQKVCCLISTTCSLPQKPNDIVGISQVCKKYAIPHIIVSDHGLQCTKIMEKIKKANESGKVDAVLYNASENLLVPTGSSVVASFDNTLLAEIAKTYPGRASSSSTIDIFISLLSLGKNGYLKLLHDKERLCRYFQESLSPLADKYKKFITSVMTNPTSVALFFSGNIPDLSRLKQVLRRSPSINVYFLTTRESKTLSNYKFEEWGTHGAVCTMPLIVFRLSLGTSQNDIDNILENLDLCLSKTK
ncbi:hypothetical protein Trydic_g1727 [Trypoxylus dichotomus]